MIGFPTESITQVQKNFLSLTVPSIKSIWSHRTFLFAKMKQLSTRYLELLLSRTLIGCYSPSSPPLLWSTDAKDSACSPIRRKRKSMNQIILIYGWESSSVDMIHHSIIYIKSSYKILYQIKMPIPLISSNSVTICFFLSVQLK